MTIIIQEDSFSISKMILELSEKDNVGAVVSFSGYVREFSKERQLKYMELEHYPGMTEKALESIVQKAKSHWGIEQTTIIHRVGKLLPKDVIVGVIVSSRHRSNAFKACEFIIDFLKTDAPFWKKEISDKGEVWVSERQEDIIKKTNWNKLD
ncbi:molybdenum cofactor biosynthesis protein MoaE [Methylophilaceae bacterium]|nr:molybdenum cofactor biosynthesis protein MoaE [Methylophilaceae bacterium]